MKIAVGCPVHNRLPVLQQYLISISQLDWCGQDVVFVFLANNCNEPTLDALRTFKKIATNTQIYEYNNVKSTTSRKPHRYEPLARIRNELLSHVRELGCDYFFSVDSDLITPTDSLGRLLSHEKDIVSGLVYNDLHMGANRDQKDGHICNIMYWNGLKDKNGFPKASHIRNYPDNALIPVDITGAFVLMSRKVVDAVHYRYHPQGEDLGWSADFQRRGLKAYCDTSVRATHLMTTQEFQHYMNGHALSVSERIT